MDWEDGEPLEGVGSERFEGSEPRVSGLKSGLGAGVGEFGGTFWFWFGLPVSSLPETVVVGVLPPPPPSFAGKFPLPGSELGAGAGCVGSDSGGRVTSRAISFGLGILVLLLPASVAVGVLPLPPPSFGGTPGILIPGVGVGVDPPGSFTIGMEGRVTGRPFVGTSPLPGSGLGAEEGCVGIGSEGRETFGMSIPGVIVGVDPPIREATKGLTTGIEGIVTGRPFVRRSPLPGSGLEAEGCVGIDSEGRETLGISIPGVVVGVDPRREATKGFTTGMEGMVTGRPFEGTLPLPGSGVGVGVGEVCVGTGSEGRVRFGISIPGVVVGVDPPRREETKGFTTGIEGMVTGRPFEGSGVGVEEGCVGTGSEGMVTFGISIPGVVVGVDPPRREATKGFTTGMEGIVPGRPFKGSFPLPGSGLGVEEGCEGTGSEGRVTLGISIPGVVVGVDPPRREATKGLTTGMEGIIVGRPFEGSFPLPGSGLGAGAGCVGTGSGGGVTLGMLIPGVDVGVDPPRRGVISGFTTGMEGTGTGRSTSPRRPKLLEASMLKLDRGFGKCFVRRSGIPCILEVQREKKLGRKSQ